MTPEPAHGPAGDRMAPWMPQPRSRPKAGPGGLELTGCPQCSAPASVVSGYGMAGSDGTVEHVRVWCADGHWFLMPRDMLHSPARGQV